MTAPDTASAQRPTILVDFALQGGGAHGAFTWGVLDRLLEEPWLRIDGISGTSAGAMNAAVLIDGHAAGGAAGAREALERFWRRVSGAASLSPLRRGPIDVLLGRWTLDFSPAFLTMDLMSRVFSPYLLGPLATNPLQQILSDLVDFERLARAPIKLFVTAQTYTPAARAYSATPRLPHRCCSPPRACRSCSRLSRSTASPIGTVAIRAIPRSPH